MLSAGVGDAGAREVEGVSLLVQHHFHDAGLVVFVGLGFGVEATHHHGGVF